jgi:hypothetical protein
MHFAHWRAVVAVAALLLGLPARQPAQQQGGAPKPGKKATSDRSPAKAATEVSMLAGLEWLSRHQARDGHWACAGFLEQCAADKCGGAGDPAFDTGVTGLALAAFLGAGFTQERGQYKSTVGRALAFLMSIQGEEGCFGTRDSTRFQYNHALAALALVEAYGMSQTESLRGSAQKAVAWIMRSKNEKRGWRYGVADGASDTSVTGWMIFVLKSAAMAGLEVDKQALADASDFVEEMTDPATGRTGYQAKGGPSSRLDEKSSTAFPPQNGETLTAIGMLVRIDAGHGRDDPMVMKGAEILSKALPIWKPDHLDFCYWQLGSLAMYQVAGAPWEMWNEAMKTSVIPHQNRDPKRHDCGSWDPVDAWSAAGGRVYSTAMLCLCLEVYYRYPRIYGVEKK